MTLIGVSLKSGTGGSEGKTASLLAEKTVIFHHPVNVVCESINLKSGPMDLGYRWCNALPEAVCIRE